MTTNEPQPAVPQPERGEQPAGRTGEGSQSIVTELAHRQRRVDELVNRAGRPDPQAGLDDEAT